MLLLSIHTVLQEDKLISNGGVGGSGGAFAAWKFKFGLSEHNAYL